MRRIMLSLMTLCASLPMMAQASAVARCSATILPAESRGYDPASEVRLQGRVEETGVASAQGPAVRVRLRFGTVLVQVGAAGLVKGESVDVVASKQQVEGCQVFVARQVRRAAGTLVLRNEHGVPVA